MNLQFYFMLDIIIISRLVFTLRDSLLTKKLLIFLSLIQTIGLLIYQVNIALFLAIFLIINNIFFYWLEHKKFDINKLRLLSLLTSVIILSIFFSEWIGLDFNQNLFGHIKKLEKYSLLFLAMRKINWLEFSITLMGFGLVLNEVNILIRYQFHIFDLVPKKVDESNELIIDQREYNAGRIIGILERLIIYIAVLKGQFAIIGFILAAKAFTRFKELDERKFAEYVLIGTLISILLAILVALIVKILLNETQSIL